MFTWMNGFKLWSQCDNCIGGSNGFQAGCISERIKAVTETAWWWHTRVHHSKSAFLAVGPGLVRCQQEILCETVHLFVPLQIHILGNHFNCAQQNYNVLKCLNLGCVENLSIRNESKANFSLWRCFTDVFGGYDGCFCLKKLRGVNISYTEIQAKTPERWCLAQFFNGSQLRWLA